jgi:hypothetical protein
MEPAQLSTLSCPMCGGVPQSYRSCNSGGVGDLGGVSAVTYSIALETMASTVGEDTQSLSTWKTEETCS